jgi:hypothetical protein
MKTGIKLAVLFLLFSSLFGAEKADNGECKVRFPSDDGIPWYCLKVEQGDTAESLFGLSWENVLRFNRIDRLHIKPGIFLKVPRDLDKIVKFSPFPQKIKNPPAIKYIILDTREMFLGCYENGVLKYSFPATPGRYGATPKGVFRVLQFDKRHFSTVYTIGGSRQPYPMFWGINFLMVKKKVGREVYYLPHYWIHSRDMPGYPASHGCVGLYDEYMQKKYRGLKKTPVLNDAEKFFKWLFPDVPDKKVKEKFHYPTGAPDILIKIK